MCDSCGCGRFEVESVSPLCSATSGCSCAHVVLCACGISSCRSRCNGYMNVVMFCCHVRRYMRVSHVMLQNAVCWLHGCCRGLVLGGSRSAKHCVFPCKVAAAGDEGQLVCEAVAGWVRPRLGAVRTAMVSR